MRQSKIIKLGDREVTVKEISPRMVMDLLKKSGPKEGEGPPGSLAEGFSFESFDSLCREGCGLSSAEIAGLYGSEIALLWNAFQEVNSFFFKMAGLLGMDTLPVRIGAAITETFSSELAGLLKSVTSAPPTTDGSSSP